MLRYLILPALAAGAVAAPALAQDEPAPPPAPAERIAAPFTGARVEALAGYDGDLVYGGALGYDHQFGRLVLGIEGELSDSTGKDCFTAAFAPGDRFCTLTGRNIALGGRIGVALAPATLLYGKVGYTNQRVTVDYLAGSPPAVPSFRVSNDLDGIRLGAGIEQKIGRHAYIKGEYRYSDYENGDFKHDGVIGLGFRF
jgi:outer membrane immunogenic protein